MNLLTLIIGLPILIISAILHEIAHGLVADRLGDPTARLSGRLTLNPLKHIDPYMSILLPVFLLLGGSPVIFGGAKPVPIDPYNLREGHKDIALVALAGPLTNIILAIIASLLMKLLLLFGAAPNQTLSIILSVAYFILMTIAQMNILLAIFNLLPIPPLDGSKVFALLLPEKEAQMYMSLGNIGIVILFFLLVFPIGGFSLGSLMNTLYIFTEHLLGI